MSDILYTEKNVMTEVLQSYREQRCLWDSTHLLYKDKKARRQALNVVLERYRLLYPDANIDSLRKKLDCMRTSYRRERRKMCAMPLSASGRDNRFLVATCINYYQVLASIASGDDPPHMPTLWYFNLISFVDGPFMDDITQSLNQNTSCEDNDEESSLLKRRLLETDHQNNMVEEYIDEEFETQYYDSDAEDQPNAKKPTLASVYVTEEDSKKKHVDKFLNEHVNNTKENNTPETSTSMEESESFGRTVGLQLKQLDGFQRTVAEKLISEVIFYARLNKLSANSYFNLNADKYL